MKFTAAILSAVYLKEVLIFAVFALFIKWFSIYLKRNHAFHEISSLKGPQAFPVIGNALIFLKCKDTGDILNKIHESLDKYSAPMRFWFGWHLCYGTTDPAEWEVILNHPGGYQKINMYKALSPFLGEGLFVADAPKWKKMRKIIMPTFNQQILNSFVPVFAEKGSQLVEDLGKYCGKGYIDIMQPINQRTVEVICETAMGLNGDMAESCRNYGPLASRCFEIAFLRMFVFFYNFDFIYRFTSLAKEEREILKTLNSFIGTVVHKKKIEYQNNIKKNAEYAQVTKGTKRKAFLELLIELSDEANLTETELLEETQTFMVAGSDTSATVICFTILMLGMHQNIQEKVYEEIKDVIGNERNIEHSDIPKLKYLEMVIKETLRLFPVGPIIGRTLQCDIETKSRKIPAGVDVIIPILYAQRSAKYWPNPLKFIPERFTPEECAKRHPYTWLPFGGGPRNCIGFKYGMMSVKAMVATLIRRYRFTSRCKSVEDISLGANVVLKSNDGYKCAITLRE